MSRRTEMPYKAESLGKIAVAACSVQHVNVRGTGDTVNGAVAQGKFTFLSLGDLLSMGLDVVSSENYGRDYRFPNVPAQMEKKDLPYL